MKKATPQTLRQQRGRVATEIISGLKDILADIRGQRRFSGRTHIVDVAGIKSLRKKLNVSQLEFARRYGFNRRTLQEWEQGRAAPDQSHRAYLRVIAHNPKAVARALAAAK